MIDFLLHRFGDRASINSDVRQIHGQDESFHKAAQPDLVVFPKSTNEVSEIVVICAKHKVPIVPFGAGTSLEGHIAAIRGGVCIDLSQMNKVLEINPSDMDVHIEAGTSRKTLNKQLEPYGLFFPVDPGADATLGGMVATSASGTNAVRYGTIRDNLLGLTAVMPNGQILTTGGRARKSASGYDLTRLLCGSEGTLAVITEIRLKLYGLPEANSVGVCSFKSLKDAVDTAAITIQMGVPVARIELLDDIQINAVNKFSGLDYEEKPTLFFEFHGTARSVVEQSEQVAEIIKDLGGSEFVWSVKQEDKNKLWQARHDAYYASMALRPGCVGWPTDVCVPISRLTECIVETVHDIDEAGVTAPVFGHVGDGNFHVILLLHPDDPEEVREAQLRINERLISRAISLGGTCTGEQCVRPHPRPCCSARLLTPGRWRRSGSGVGVGKIDHLEHEHGAGAVEMMREIKRALDPNNIMNPGKMLSGL